MIRGRMTNHEGRPVLVIGLSRQNIEALQDDRPIWADGHTFGIPEVAAVFIFAGETEDEMAKTLCENFDVENLVDMRKIT